ncbi:HAMP domain-containing sensor histidine kinase [Clostridium sp. C2-6-12]|uniref:sensor histidine kinase n=1 Tax=Clostridium sp. C2-6-12 TaxID=2698832 RepID=UPI0013691B52|nr:HAMP domain-containing sensor histidine kinase [Clostridium sp. C2-6-12]
MRTIKGKLITIFMLIMIALVLSGVILNSIGLKAYYIYKNKNVFVTISEKISKEYADNNESSLEYITDIEELENINTMIVDQNFNIEYNSALQKIDNKQQRLSKEMEQIILDNKKKLLKNAVYYIGDKNDDEKSKLVFVSQMSNGKFIILRKSIRSISQSVFIANQFYMISGTIVILIGSICILIFAEKISKPIIEMSNIAENISNLKFDNRVKVQSQDEIGKLGQSINKISEKLSVSIEELKKDVERRKQLVRNMSHELKTPIGIIKGYAEGLKYGVADDQEKMEKYCNVLVEECDRMDKLIFELLNHSMLEAGMVKINVTSFNIYDLIAEISERFKAEITEKGITFNLKCENDFQISADRDMLEKAINNFITNAIDHVEGGNLIELNAEKRGSGIKVSVFNTGSHIPGEAIDKIWDVYYKVDKARSRKYGGHGLGLSIVKSVIKLHGGSVNVENVQDGVKFGFEIP